MNVHEELLDEAREAGLTDDEARRALEMADILVISLEKMELAFAAFRGLLPGDRSKQILAEMATKLLDKAAAEGMDRDELELARYLLALMTLADATGAAHAELQNRFRTIMEGLYASDSSGSETSRAERESDLRVQGAASPEGGSGPVLQDSDS